MDGVDEADAGDDVQALRQRHERPDPLDRLAHLVRDDTGDQDVALLAGAPQRVADQLTGFGVANLARLGASSLGPS